LDNPWAVVAFVGIFVVVFGARWLAGKAGSKVAEKVHQTVNSDDRRTGNYLYDGVWEWTTAAPWGVVRQAALREWTALHERIRN
jgi:hypothetical protein